MKSRPTAPASVWAWIGLNTLVVIVVAIPGGVEFGRGWGPAVGAVLFWSIALLLRWRWARVILAVWSLASALAIAVLLIAK